MLTGIYAGLLGLIFIYLTFRVIGARRRAQKSIGDGGDIPLRRAIRAHGNFMEYVPFSLLLIFMLQQQQAQAWLLHALGGSLLLGRLIHAWAISQFHEPLKYRVLGMLLTLLSLGGASIALIVLAF